MNFVAPCPLFWKQYVSDEVESEKQRVRTCTPVVEDEVVEDEAVEDEVVEDEAVEDEAVEDEAVEDEAVEDEAVEDEAVEDEAVAHEAETPYTPNIFHSENDTFRDTRYGCNIKAPAYLPIRNILY